MCSDEEAPSLIPHDSRVFSRLLSAPSAEAEPKTNVCVCVCVCVWLYHFYQVSRLSPYRPHWRPRVGSLTPS